MKELTLLVDKSKAKVTCNVEHVSRSSPVMRRLLMGTFSMVYCVSGKIRVSGGESAQESKTETLVAHSTFYIERLAADVTPLQVQVELLEGNKFDSTDECATFVVIDVHEVPSDSNATFSRSLSDTSVQNGAKAKGGVLVFDDQPLWVVPTDGDNRSPKNLLLSSMDSSNSFMNWESAIEYHPPPHFTNHVNESAVPPPEIRDTLVIDEYPMGQISTVWINMMKQGLSEFIRIPVIVARGIGPGYEFESVTYSRFIHFVERFWVSLLLCMETN